jgi:hypothetical protein
MGLTSDWFMAVVITAVVLLPLGTAVIWNRLCGPRPVRAISRLGLIVLCQGTAVLLAAIFINNSFQLYTSWSDLFGDDGGPGRLYSAQPMTVAASAQVVTAGGERSLPNAGLFRSFPSVSGALTATITGPKSNITATVLVWLPPQYNDPRYARSDFPVLQLLSGFPGSPGTWLTGMGAPRILRQQSAAGAAHPFILVAAAINVDGRHDADCSDIPGGPAVATWLARDVPDLIETSFRADRTRDGWGLMGYSEGGLCASKLVLQYSDTYSAGVSMSGDDHPVGDLLRRGTGAYDLNCPLWLIEHRPPPERVSLLLTGTAQDGATAAEAAAMGWAAGPTVRVDQMIAQRGGHNIGVWQSVEPAAFAWLSDRLSGVRKSLALAPRMPPPQ